MDRITEWFFSLNNAWFDAFSRAINDPTIFILFIAATALVLEQRNDKRLKIATAVILSVFLGVALKELYQIQRPCTLELGKVACPNEYSFPSVHAAVAFTFMTAFINKKYYPLVVFGALVIAASRMYLGVHTFEDITGGLIIAPFAYVITDMWWKRHGKRN